MIWAVANGPTPYLVAALRPGTGHARAQPEPNAMSTSATTAALIFQQAVEHESLRLLTLRSPPPGQTSIKVNMSWDA